MVVLICVWRRLPECFLHHLLARPIGVPGSLEMWILWPVGHGGAGVVVLGAGPDVPGQG